MGIETNRSHLLALEALDRERLSCLIDQIKIAASSQLAGRKKSSATSHWVLTITNSSQPTNSHQFLGNRIEAGLDRALRAIHASHVSISPEPSEFHSRESTRDFLSASFVNPSGSQSPPAAVCTRNLPPEIMNTLLELMSELKLPCRVFNLGNCYESPLEGLLLLYLLHVRCKLETLESVNVAIIGDLTHSPVLRSFIAALSKFDVAVHLIAPESLICREFLRYRGVSVYHNIGESPLSHQSEALPNMVLCIPMTQEAIAAPVSTSAFGGGLSLRPVLDYPRSVYMRTTTLTNALQDFADPIKVPALACSGFPEFVIEAPTCMDIASVITGIIVPW